MSPPPGKLHRVNGYDAVAATETALRVIHARRHDSHFVGNLLSALADQGFYLGVADREVEPGGQVRAVTPLGPRP